MINLTKLTDAQITALSYVITTATEGGIYTREDYREWTEYKHGDYGVGGQYFRAEVTLHPNTDDGIEISGDPIRMTAEEFARRLKPYVADPKIASHHRAMIARLLAGDDDIAGEMDVVDSGAVLQIAVYGEVVYG
jgi:hypothetical protein